MKAAPQDPFRETTMLIVIVSTAVKSIIAMFVPEGKRTKHVRKQFFNSF